MKLVLLQSNPVTQVNERPTNVFAIGEVQGTNLGAQVFFGIYDGATLSTTGTSRLGPGLVPAFGNVGKPVLCPSSNCNGRGRAIRSTFFQTNQQQTTPQT